MKIRHLKNYKNSTTSWLWCMNKKKMLNITLWDEVGAFFSIMFCKRLQVSYHRQVFSNETQRLVHISPVGPGKVSAFFFANTDNIAWKQLCYIIYDHHHLKVANIIKNKQREKCYLYIKNTTYFSFNPEAVICSKCFYFLYNSSECHFIVTVFSSNLLRKS